MGTPIAEKGPHWTVQDDGQREGAGVSVPDLGREDAADETKEGRTGMRRRSWMAALKVAARATLVLGLGALGTRVLADEVKGVSKPAETKKPAANPKATYKVILDLGISGLSAKGCDVQIKPAHPGCKFEPVSRHIGEGGKAEIEIKDIESSSADRDCTFAITVREAGQTEKVVRRGLRLKTAGTTAQTLSCFFSSPSKLAKAEKEAAQAKR
jgi:hypothetical protein